MVTNWSLISAVAGLSTVKSFATGEISGKQFYSNVVGTDASGVVRTLLREHGTAKARRLARKAIRRRAD